MGEKWRVTVERYEDESETLAEAWVQEIELVASREQLAGFAPGVVADALGVSANAESVTVTMDNSVATSAWVAAEPAKRKRRTKAEMEAALQAKVDEIGPDPHPVEGETSTVAEVAAPEAPFNPFAPK